MHVVARHLSRNFANKPGLHQYTHSMKTIMSVAGNWCVPLFICTLEFRPLTVFAGLEALSWCWDNFKDEWTYLKFSSLSNIYNYYRQTVSCWRGWSSMKNKTLAKLQNIKGTFGKQYVSSPLRQSFFYSKSYQLLS